MEGLPDVPRFEWGEIALEELDGKANRLVNYTKAGLINPDSSLEKYIRAREGLPPYRNKEEVSE